MREEFTGTARRGRFAFSATTVTTSSMNERGMSTARGGICTRSTRPSTSWLAAGMVTRCGLLTAAKLIGGTADACRFKSKDADARHNGTAPLPVWSGNRARHRLSRTGRQIKACLHRIASTQARSHEGAGALLQRRCENGDSKSGSIRVLQRRLSDLSLHALLLDAVAYSTNMELVAVSYRRTGKSPRFGAQFTTRVDATALGGVTFLAKLLIHAGRAARDGYANVHQLQESFATKSDGKPDAPPSVLPLYVGDAGIRRRGVGDDVWERGCSTASDRPKGHVG